MPAKYANSNLSPERCQSWWGCGGCRAIEKSQPGHHLLARRTGDEFTYCKHENQAKSKWGGPRRAQATLIISSPMLALLGNSAECDPEFQAAEEQLRGDPWEPGLLVGHQSRWPWSRAHWGHDVSPRLEHWLAPSRCARDLCHWAKHEVIRRGCCIRCIFLASSDHPFWLARAEWGLTAMPRREVEKPDKN